MEAVHSWRKTTGFFTKSIGIHQNQCRTQPIVLEDHGNLSCTIHFVNNDDSFLHKTGCVCNQEICLQQLFTKPKLGEGSIHRANPRIPTWHPLPHGIQVYWVRNYNPLIRSKLAKRVLHKTNVRGYRSSENSMLIPVNSSAPRHSPIGETWHRPHCWWLPA